MGQIVSGYILSHSFGGKEHEIHRHNRSAIAHLPESGRYLLRSMFSLAPLDFRLHINTFQTIHFAASYDEMYALDKGWYKEFEDLLRTLSWCEAVAFHSYTGMRVNLVAKDHQMGEEAIPTRSWTSTFYDSYHYTKEITPREMFG